MNPSRHIVVTLLVAFGAGIAVFAWWLWDASGAYVCDSMFAMYDANTGLCTGGKIAPDEYRVTDSERMNGVMGIAANLVTVLFALIMGLGGLFVAYWFRHNQKPKSTP